MIEYVPLQAALDPTYLSRSLRRLSDDNTILSNMLSAYRMLNVNQRLEESTKIVKLANHSIGTLPDDVHTINLVTYVLSPVDPDNYRIDDYDLQPLRYVGNRTINMTLNDYNNSTCKVCTHPELSSCSETYTITTFRELTTSVKDGYVCLDYLKEPKDDESNFLIVKHQDVLRFLGVFAESAIWKERANNTEAGAYNIYKDYLQTTEILFRKAKGSLIQRNIDLAMIDSVVGTNTYNQRLMRCPSFIFSKKDN